MNLILKAIVIIALGLCFVQNSNSQKINSKDVIISGRFCDGNGNDSVRLLLWRNYLTDFTSNAQIPPDTIWNVCNDGAFKIRLSNLIQSSYFSLDFNRYDTSAYHVPLMYNFFCEPGDSIFISFPKIKPVFIQAWTGRTIIKGWNLDSMAFAGAGVGKYKFLIAERNKDKEVETESIRKSRSDALEKLPSAPPVFDSVFFSTYPKKFRNSSRYCDSVKQSKLAFLKRYKGQMSADAYQLLKTDIAAEQEYQKCRSYAFYATAFEPEMDSVSLGFKNRMVDTLTSIFEKSKFFDFTTVPERILALSNSYIHFVTMEAALSKYLFKKDGYSALKQNNNTLLRDKLLTQYLVERFSSRADGDSLLRDALSIVKTQFCRDVLNEKLSHEIVGQPAYLFSLPNAKNSVTKISDFKGKVVFMDFWYTGCGGCMHFYKDELSKVEDYYKDNDNIVFITVSIDKDRVQWLESVKGGQYTSDRHNNVVNLYTEGRGIDHPVIRAYNVISYPRPIVIDKEGKIYKVNAIPWNAEKLIEILGAALRKKD